jgi:hypothetical protein
VLPPVMQGRIQAVPRIHRAIPPGENRVGGWQHRNPAFECGKATNLQNFTAKTPRAPRNVRLFHQQSHLGVLGVLAVNLSKLVGSCQLAAKARREASSPITNNF